MVGAVTGVGALTGATAELDEHGRQQEGVDKHSHTC